MGSSKDTSIVYHNNKMLHVIPTQKVINSATQKNNILNKFSEII